MRGRQALAECTRSKPLVSDACEELLEHLERFDQRARRLASGFQRIGRFQLARQGRRRRDLRKLGAVVGLRATTRHRGQGSLSSDRGHQRGSLVRARDCARQRRGAVVERSQLLRNLIAHRVRVRPPRLLVPGERPVDECHETRGGIGSHCRKRGSGARSGDLERRVAAVVEVQSHPGQQREHRRPDREDVSRFVDLAPVPRRLLGRHEAWGSNHHAGRQIAHVANARDSEVDHLHIAAVRDVEVGGLQVAMENAGAMTRGEQVEHAFGHAQHRGGRQLVPGPLPLSLDGRSLELFHHEEWLAQLGGALVEHGHETRMLHRASDPCLTLEAFPGLGIA